MEQRWSWRKAVQWETQRAWDSNWSPAKLVEQGEMAEMYSRDEERKQSSGRGIVGQEQEGGYERSETRQKLEDGRKNQYVSQLSHILQKSQPKEARWVESTLLSRTEVCKRWKWAVQRSVN
jgi:hypothetical protein